MNLYRLKLRLKYLPVFGNLVNMYLKARSQKAVRTLEKRMSENALTLTSQIEQLLSSSEAFSDRFFLDFGGLLGFIRDGDFLVWDCDIDFGLIVNESSIWSNLEGILIKEGFKKAREFVFDGIITEQTYQKGDINIDFFAHFLSDDYSTNYVYYRKNGFIYNSRYEWHVMKYITTKINCTKLEKGNKITVHVPNNVEAYLEDVYSKDWRIPDPNWVNGSGPCSQKLDDSNIAIERVFT